MTLSEKWQFDKPILPKGKLSRWQDFRHSFGINNSEPNFAASEVIVYCKINRWIKTKKEWREIFSGERKCRRKQDLHFCLSCGRKNEIDNICNRCLVKEEIRQINKP